MSSITVGRHRHERTCALTTASPATGTFAVGDRVEITCANGVLVSIDEVDGHRNAGNDEPVTTGLSGTVTAVGAGAITVHDGENTLSCTIGATSPSLTGYGVGTHARIGCENGVLVSIGAPPGGPPPPNPGPTIPKITNASGPIRALAATSITVA